MFIAERVSDIRLGIIGHERLLLHIFAVRLADSHTSSQIKAESFHYSEFSKTEERRHGQRPESVPEEHPALCVPTAIDSSAIASCIRLKLCPENQAFLGSA